MSLWNHRLDQNTNENFDSFCTGSFRAEIINFFVGILVQTKTSERHFEINWPLVRTLTLDDLLLWKVKKILEAIYGLFDSPKKTHKIHSILS